MLYETQAILRYLDRTLRVAGTDAKPAASCGADGSGYEYLRLVPVSGRQQRHRFQRVVRPRLLGQPADEAAIAKAMPKAYAVINELSRLLAGRPHFAGDAVSLADLMVAPQFDFLRQTPEWALLTAKTANLGPWLDRMLARDSFTATTWERIAALAAAA